MAGNSVPIELSRKRHPYSYQFHFVTVQLKNGRTVKCDNLFWTPKDEKGEYLVARNQTIDRWTAKSSFKSEVLPVDGTIVFVEDVHEKFIFEICEANNLDHVCGESIAFHLSPVCHATLYSRNGHELLAKDVCVGGWRSKETKQPVLAYFNENKYHDDAEWVSKATRVPIDTLVFAPEKEICWETSNLVWP
jgi:hypothetical protein